MQSPAQALLLNERKVNATLSHRTRWRTPGTRAAGATAAPWVLPGSGSPDGRGGAPLALVEGSAARPQTQGCSACVRVGKKPPVSTGSLRSEGRSRQSPTSAPGAPQDRPGSHAVQSTRLPGHNYCLPPWMGENSVLETDGKRDFPLSGRMDE